MNKIIFTVALSLFLGMSNVSANQENSERGSERAQQSSRFERFINRSGTFIFSKSYSIGKMREGSAYDVTVVTAWDMGSSEKVYAARLSGLYIDYEELENFQQEIDKIIESVEKSSDELNRASMRYRALNGLEFFYSVYESNPGEFRRYLSLNLRGNILAATSMKSVVDLSTLVMQAREKLISLGAK